MKRLLIAILVFVSNVSFAQAQGYDGTVNLGGSGYESTSINLGGEGIDTPPSQQYDPDAQALFDRMTAAGNSPTEAQMTAINTFYVNMKADGYLTGWDWFCIPAVTSGSGAGLLNWVRNVSALNVNSVTFSNGWTGNGTTSYLNLQESGADWTHYTQDDNAVFVIVGSDVANNNMVDIGGRTVNLYTYILSRNGSNKMQSINNSTTATTSTGNVTNSIGFFWLSRTSPIEGLQYQNNTSIGTITSTTTGVPTDNFFVCAYNVAGTPLLFSTRLIKGWGIGKSRSGAEVTGINGHIETLLDALGLGVIP